MCAQPLLPLSSSCVPFPLAAPIVVHIFTASVPAASLFQHLGLLTNAACLMGCLVIKIEHQRR